MKSHRPPQQTIQAYCHYCLQSRMDTDVENCTGHIVYATGKPCPFYECRMGHKRQSVKVMRRFCLECQGNNLTFVRKCETRDCLIYPFRSGKNPALAREGKTADEMSKIRAMRRPSAKGISFNLDRTPIG